MKKTVWHTYSSDLELHLKMLFSVCWSSLNTHVINQKRITAVEKGKTFILPFHVTATQLQFSNDILPRFSFPASLKSFVVFCRPINRPSFMSLATVLAAQLCSRAVDICTNWWVVVMEGITTYSQPRHFNVQQQSFWLHWFLFKLWKNEDWPCIRYSVAAEKRMQRTIPEWITSVLIGLSYSMFCLF